MKRWKIIVIPVVVAILLLFIFYPAVNLQFDATGIAYGGNMNDLYSPSGDVSFSALMGLPGYVYFPQNGCGNILFGAGNSNLFNDKPLFPNYCNPGKYNESSVVQNQCSTFSLNTTVSVSGRLLYDCRNSAGVNQFAIHSSIGVAFPVFNLPKGYSNLSLVNSSSLCPLTGEPGNGNYTIREEVQNLTLGFPFGFGGGDYDYCVSFSGALVQTLPSSFIHWYQTVGNI